MGFFTRAPPPRIPRTRERFLTPGTPGHRFFEELAGNLDATGRSLFESQARHLSNASDAHDEHARDQLKLSYSHLIDTSRRLGSRTHMVESSTSQIADTIVQMMRGIRRRYTDNTAHGRLVRYEIRDGFSPLDRVLLPWLFPCCGCGDGNKTPEQRLEEAYREANSDCAYWVQRAIMLAVALLFVFSILCLSYAQLSLYICQQGTFPLGRNVTAADTHAKLSCWDLVGRCGVPEFGGMGIPSYYSWRIFVYLASLVPFMLLAASPFIMSMKLLHPLVVVDATDNSDTAAGFHGHNSAGGPHLQDSREILRNECPMCNPVDYDASHIFRMAATIFFFTHCVGGIATIVMDAAVAHYIQNLPARCHSAADLAIQPWDGDCACSVIFAGDHVNGLMQVSTIEIMSPAQIAIFLIVQNVLYTLWGLYFVFQTWTWGVLDRRYARMNPFRHVADDHAGAEAHGEAEEAPDGHGHGHEGHGHDDGHEHGHDVGHGHGHDDGHAHGHRNSMLRPSPPSGSLAPSDIPRLGTSFVNPLHSTAAAHSTEAGHA